MRLPLFAALALVAFVVQVHDGSVTRAEQGVALGRATFEISDRLVRGHEYRLPVLQVVNPGDERTTYRMYVEPIPGSTSPAAQPGWFRFEPAEFALDPLGSQAVTIYLTVGDGTEPTGYAAFVGAAAVNEGPGSHINVAAAAPVTFTVRSTNLWEDVRRTTSDFFAGRLPWIAGAVILASLGIFAWRLRHVRIRIERAGG